MHKIMFHIGDFMRDTAHLSPLEECFYRRALDFYYLNEKPLPKETSQVFRRLRAITEEDKNAVLNVLNDFFFEEKDGFHNHRCDVEIEKYQKNAEKSRENGKSGGRPKKNKSSDNQQDKTSEVFEKTSQVILGFENETQKNLNQEPITNNHKPKENNKSSSNDDLVIQIFEYWQRVFNKPRTKLDAKRKTKIKQRLADGRTIAEIQTAIDNCSKSEFHVVNGHIDIELICRDDSKFESFLSRSNQPVLEGKPSNNANGYIDFSTVGQKPEILVSDKDEPDDFPF